MNKFRWGCLVYLSTNSCLYLHWTTKCGESKSRKRKNPNTGKWKWRKICLVSFPPHLTLKAGERGGWTGSERKGRTKRGSEHAWQATTGWIWISSFTVLPLYLYRTRPRPAFGRQGLGGSSGGYSSYCLQSICSLTTLFNSHNMNTSVSQKVYF